jgi:K+-transporting ATPase A subunit
MTDLLLWLHIGFAIFALGPVTAATMSTPRFIRARNLDVLRHLHRTTRIYAIASVGVFLFGVLLGREYLGRPYLSVSMTLFIVAAVLLVVVERDQGAALRALGNENPEDDAKVQTGRIATLSGLTALIWLVILVLMVWGNP